LHVEKLYVDNKIKILRNFKCPYESCQESFYTNRQYFRHCDIKHVCDICLTLHENVNEHLCTEKQIGKGTIQAKINSLSKLNTGKFDVTENMYRTTILTLSHTFQTSFASFEDAFEFLYEDIESILTQCIELQKSIKASFSIGATLIDMKEEKRREFPFFSPFQRFSHKNFITSSVMAATDYLITSLNVFNQDASCMRLESINF